jgi:hypothetical protein
MKSHLLSLNFNCTCWQNRKARIYLSGTEFDAAADQNFRKILDQGPTRIVLASPTHSNDIKQVILSDGSKANLYTDGTTLDLGHSFFGEFFFFF